MMGGKKMKKVVSATLCLILAVCLSPVYAGEAGNNYMAFKPGIYSPQASRIDDFDDGFHGEIAFGYKYNPYFSAEMAVGYYHTEDEFRFVTASGTKDVDFNIDVYPLTLTLKGGFPIEALELYGLAGVGVHIVRGGKADDTVFGFHLGGGAIYNLTPTWFIGAEGKYLWTGKADFEETVMGERFKGKTELNGILATAVVGFRF
jgi:opacity protein-like surface antigen